MEAIIDFFDNNQLTILAICILILLICVPVVAKQKQQKQRNSHSIHRSLYTGRCDVDEKADLWEVVDGMTGHSFEFWCAGLLEDNGFQDVRVTPGSGDQGVDILAEKDDIKYAIQCKCYSSDLGNTPVQEVYTGKVIYHCHVGVVMTNSFFTKGAIEAADCTGVLLWDRKKLMSLYSTSVEKSKE